MNLLPKAREDFGQKDYWEGFFKKRGAKAFEWYGEYLELCGQLHKYIKQKDDILITGCGNSSLSADLYDVGYQNITNIDISEVVIKQMKAVNAQRTNMEFIQMDALNMSFENEKFNVIIDKGTLDALMPDDSEAVNMNIDKYFSEIQRVLRMGGRYICVTLLQEHILRKLLSYFANTTWIFRVVRCHEAEQKNIEEMQGNTMPVFVVIATKFKALPQLMMEICMAGDKMQRLQTTNDVISVIKSTQKAAIVTNGLAKNSLAGQNEVSLDLFNPGEDVPRYTLYILDQPPQRNLNKYAAFIVPQGRELDWMFGTSEGRKELIKCAQYTRLAIVTMHREHSYEDLDSVKAELTDSIKRLAPSGYLGQIPFLSLGGDVGKREILFKGTSEISGDFVVEDVVVDSGALFRRLIFLNNQFLIQSEAKLKKVKSKNIVDISYLACNHHIYLSVGVKLATSQCKQSEVAIIGLGGGGLCSFLHKCIDDVKIVAIDIDKAVYQVAVDYFGLKIDDRLTVEIEDGIHFLQTNADKAKKYQAIIFDIDNKDRSISLSCPPKQFIEDHVLDNVVKCLHPEGFFLLNLVCRDKQLHDEVLNTLSKYFKSMASVRVEQEVNEVVFCTNRVGYNFKDELQQSGRNLNLTAKRKKLTTNQLFEITDLLKSLHILS